MQFFRKNIQNFIFNYNSFSDPRVMDYAFMRNLWPIVLLLCSYLYFILHFGPNYMKNRPAYDLKTFIKFFNLFHILGNAYVVREILAAYPDILAFKCVPPDYSRNPNSLRVSSRFHSIFKRN